MPILLPWVSVDAKLEARSQVDRLVALRAFAREMGRAVADDAGENTIADSFDFHRAIECQCKAIVGHTQQ